LEYSNIEDRIPNIKDHLLSLLSSPNIASKAPVFQVELSRDPRALMRLLDQIPTDATTRSMLKPKIHTTTSTPSTRAAV
ncbi:MAG TPA: hypothetical protein PK402_04780, partial [Tepidisphaeraceae bacterium]|nr:hypothetical protein [Tepidisphaeraceae bacterium]